MLIAGMTIGQRVIENIDDCIYTALQYKVNALQIFNGSPSKVNPANIKLSILPKLKKDISDAGLHLFIHTKFVFNLSSSEIKFKFPMIMIERDIRLGIALGAKGLVFHTGSSIGKNIIEAQRNMSKNIANILRRVPWNSDLKILIETPNCYPNESSCGLETLYAVGYNNVIKQARGKSEYMHFTKHLGFCIDTAHIWNSGYDIRNPSMAEKVYSYIMTALNGKVFLIHINDSKNTLGSRNQDEHETLLKGYAFTPESLKILIAFAKNYSIPLVLETPEKSKFQTTHRKEINLIKTLAK